MSDPFMVRPTGQRKLQGNPQSGKSMEAFPRARALKRHRRNHQTDKQEREKLLQVQVEWERKTTETWQGKKELGRRRNYYPGQSGEVRRAEERRSAVIWQKKACKALKGRCGEGEGGGGRVGWGGLVHIWLPAAGWFSGQSLTQMFAQCPGQALAGSQTFK